MQFPGPKSEQPASLADPACLPATDAWSGAHFVRGDANHDKGVDISDAVFNLTYLFSGGEAPPCEDAADVDDEAAMKIARDIANKVESEMTYPGEIQITLLREVRCIEYAK